MKQIIKQLMIFFGIIFIVIIIINIFFLSYASYADYNSISWAKKIENVGFYLPYNDTIVIFNNSTKTLRHELCHRDAFKNNQTYGYWQEVRCYIEEYKFWKKVNLTTKEWEK